MTEEDFLKRWSRRKREADAAKPVPPETKTDETGAAVPENVVANQNADAPEAEFDPATLPPIESITAVSDITAFLRAGVPVELARAALRRVWTADPAIRNFVGLAENAWDFTDPAAMPGFGPLESTEEVRRMIARIVDTIGEATQPSSGDELQTTSDSKELNEARLDDQPTQVVAPAEQLGESPQDIADSQVLLQSNRVDIAMQHDPAEGEEASLKSSPPSHGRALPR